MMDEDEMPPVHPLADQFVMPTWDTTGCCACGQVLPRIAEWVGAQFSWAHTHCQCGRSFYDEDDFIAIYDDPQECEDCDPWEETDE